MEVMDCLEQNWIALLSAVIAAIALFFTCQSARSSKMSAKAALLANTNALKGARLAILQETVSFRSDFSEEPAVPSEGKLGQFHRLSVIPSAAYMPQEIALALAEIYSHCKKHQEYLDTRVTPDMLQSDNRFNEGLVKYQYKDIADKIDSTITAMRQVLQQPADN